MGPSKGKRSTCALPKRHQFTKEECKRGYRAALEKCSQSWELAAWFSSKLRGYRKRKEETDAS